MSKNNTKLIGGHLHVSYIPNTNANKTAVQLSKEFYNTMKGRRSIRHFSDKKVPKAVIESIIKTAGTAPSGAHKQPWTFCIIENPEIKKQIRIAVEKEEEKSYNERMSATWLIDLKPMGTNASKPFIETAPYLIIVFKRMFDYNDTGEKTQNYYVNESVGIACGMLISAIQNAGLSTLTHTPSPMRFLEKILKRPDNERAYLLMPVGFPVADCYVPDLKRKSFEKIGVFY